MVKEMLIAKYEELRDNTDEFLDWIATAFKEGEGYQKQLVKDFCESKYLEEKKALEEFDKKKREEKAERQARVAELKAVVEE